MRISDPNCHRPLSSSFLRLPYRILKMNHQQGTTEGPNLMYIFLNSLIEPFKIDPFKGPMV